MRKRSRQDDEKFFIIEENEASASNVTAPHTLTPEEVLGSAESDSKRIISQSHSALNALKMRMNSSNKRLKEESNIDGGFSFDSEKKEAVKENEADNGQSLLDKCMPYLIEDDGTKANINSKPLYELQSVADILKSDSEKVVESLSKKYNVIFEDLSIGESQPQEETAVEEFTVGGEEETENVPKEKESFFKSADSSFEDILVISDIDTPPQNVEKPSNDRIHNTATITFTPITESENETKLNITTHTRPLDLTGELAGIPEKDDFASTGEIRLEKDDFEEFIPDEELDTEKNGSKFIRKYSIIKRNSFLSTAISVIIGLVLTTCFIPTVTDFANSNLITAMIISSALTFIAIISNIDCFKGLLKIFSDEARADVSASLSVIAVVLYSVFGIISHQNVTHIQLLLCIILAFRAYGKFADASYMLSNLKIAVSSAPKNTLKLINDSAICMTMAENSVEGDVLIADTQPAGGITDFMKYTQYGSFLGGRLSVLTGVSLILSVILGIACGIYFDGAAYGFYAAAVIQCLTALPVSFLIDKLPLFKASKKLRLKGGMILGMAGAELAEEANAAVISADKLFPAGSITLHQMQALSANNLEDTIIRAASLTESLGSTLAPIFKSIAGTGNITALPDSDTVKYEDRMGISGWVDNRLLFIGNRTLLETHGIPVPSLEVDRKILRQGYFPVYVATQNRACALIMIQYNVQKEIADELRRLTASGVNLLISSCDPNLTEEMICDYFGLYSDSVKVMTAAGRHLHRNSAAAVKSVSAPAVCGRGHVGIASVLNCASRIKASNLRLIISYILSAVLGAVIFAYSSFAGSGNLLSGGAVLLYTLITTVVSYLLYITKKP